MSKRTALVVVAASSLLGATVVPAVAGPPTSVDVIVVFADGAPGGAVAAEATARQHRVELAHVYEHALSGFAGAVPEDRLEGLRRDPRVAYVEMDRVVTTAAQTIPTGIDRIFASDNANIPTTGTGDVVDVDVAILDTGIDLTHPDLNVVASTNCLNHSGGPPFSRTYHCSGTGNDGNGHGSHVAGTVGAYDDGAGVVGVAPGARLWAVKVLDDQGSGSWASVIAGIDHVTANAATIDVANMSLGGSGSSAALDTAIANSVAAGVTYAVAAGNSSGDVVDDTPAGHPDVLTVSALADFDGKPGSLGSPTCRNDEDDTFANFSNYGDGSVQNVDLIAPGVCILSTWKSGGYTTISGTSMASPHVAGAAAILASQGMTDGQIKTTLAAEANLDWKTDTDPDGVPDRLLDVGNAAVFAPTLVGGTAPDPTDDPPTVELTSPAAGATVSTSVTLSATATDDVGITQVEFRVDGTSVGVGSANGSTYTLEWDSASVADGDHTITATATDTAGQTTTSAPVTVTVANPGGTGPDPEGLYVSSLTGTGVNQGSNWLATVTVEVKDAAALADDVTVVFSWVTQRGVTGSATCTTGSAGTCPVSQSLAKREASVTYTVESLDGKPTNPPRPTVTIAKP
ncbi:MAG: S8 family serine peptidase [Nitriliruptor sp.]|uniref:S8 family serine peptidase n=1 Tax=Nitriliruptor sp. TaxID=2448056 RepID=UPI0034A0AC6E